MADSKTIVLVGHCGPDMFMLKSAIGRFVPGAPIETVNDAKTLNDYRNPGAVLLVNRELDGEFSTPSGIELIREVCAGDDPPAAVLISNFEEAQAQAVEAGASEGFGKSELYDEQTGQILNRLAAG